MKGDLEKEDTRSYLYLVKYIANDAIVALLLPRLHFLQDRQAEQCTLHSKSRSMYRACFRTKVEVGRSVVQAMGLQGISEAQNASALGMAFAPTPWYLVASESRLLMTEASTDASGTACCRLYAIAVQGLKRLMVREELTRLREWHLASEEAR